MIDVCFAHESVGKGDCQLYFNGFPPGSVRFNPELWDTALKVERFNDTESLAHLMARAGIFPSVTLARKNGWNKPIPDGYSQFIVSKKKHTITVLGRLKD